MSCIYGHTPLHARHKKKGAYKKSGQNYDRLTDVCDVEVSSKGTVTVRPEIPKHQMSICDTLSCKNGLRRYGMDNDSHTKNKSLSHIN